MSAFDYAPHLVGDMVELRPLAADDWEALYAVAGDPAIWAGHPAHDRCEEPVFRRFFADALAAGGGLVGIERATGAVIGSSRYAAARAGPDEVEIGWTFLARQYWGGRYNGEMKALMLAHAFRFVARVIFVIGADNIRSRTAIARVGGRLTERRLQLAMAGRTRDHVVYAIDRGDYAPLTARRGM